MDVKSSGVTWQNAWDGMKICEMYGVNSFPTIALLDHRGRIRYLGLRGEALGQKVDELLAEMKNPAKRGQ